MDQAKVSTPDLSKATGVSVDTIKKLRSREEASTTMVNGILIAHYFGKSIEDFIAMRPGTEENRLRELSDLLLPDEQRLVEAQVMGILQARGKQ